MTLRIPPIVAQNLAKLPDGNIDPDHADDCGESCLSSAVSALHGLYLSPGCIRQSVGSPLGYTTPAQLSWFLSRLGLGGRIIDATWEDFGKLRHHGRYLVALGDWIVSDAEHWMLFYQGGDGSSMAMDPWTGSHTIRSKAQWESNYVGPSVEVRLL